MEQVGRYILMAGVTLVVFGALIWLVAKLGLRGFRGLPGDIFYKSDNLVVVFPVVTCLVISLVLTAIAWFLHHFGGD